MASITKRVNADGTTSYKAQVRIKRAGVIVYQETKTFERRVAAESWAKRLELELEKPEQLARRAQAMTVGAVIKRYRAEAGAAKPLGKDKNRLLTLMEGWEIGAVNVRDLTSQVVIQHIQRRAADGAGPATVAQDVSYLRSALKYAEAAWHIGPGDAPVRQALEAVKSHGLVGKSISRDRRLHPGEEQALIGWFRTRPRQLIPMPDIIEFALATSMRLGEICRIRWQDLDEANRTLLIRDRKDPRKKLGNNQRVPLLGNAWDIVLRQPKLDNVAEIFPFKEETISAAMTRVVKALAIDDLHFHDLRHEGICRLFERGYSIQEVALVSGHKSWEMLKRYTHLRAESLHRELPELPVQSEANPDVMELLRDKARAEIAVGVSPVLAWRRLLGLRLDELAERSGFPVWALTGLEQSGIEAMTVAELRKVAAGLALPAATLLDGQ